MKRNELGFTLVEFGIVLGIFGLLTAVALLITFLIVKLPWAIVGIVVLLVIFGHRNFDENGNKIYQLGPFKIGLIRK